MTRRCMLALPGLLQAGTEPCNYAAELRKLGAACKAPVP